MIDSRTIPAQSLQRAIQWTLLGIAGVCALALLLYAVYSGSEPPPAGVIGYRGAETEAWVNAKGEPVDPPDNWPPVSNQGSVAGLPALGPAQVPSPDGAAIAFVTSTDEGAWLITKLMVKEGERVTEVAQLGGGDAPPLIVADKAGARSADGVPLVVAWSPDGQTLAWGSVNDPPYNLHLAARGAWEARALPLAGGWVGELHWSPDGRYLAISTYADDRSDHTLLVFDSLGDEPPEQLAKGCVIVWAPDSRHLALHGEPKTQPGLWVVSVDGESRRVIDRLGVAPFAWVAE